ncbi:MAG: site-specific integrase [Thaumarchaeota archaeon]|nr:site-specific integrase [Nitrososphaerota archaeon]
MKEKKYQHLLSIEKVEHWYSNVARGSLATADVYLRRLGFFCGEHRVEPLNLIHMDGKELHGLIEDFVTSKQSKYAGSYIMSTIKALRSWLSHNGVEVKLRIKVKKADDAPSLKEERVPTQEELKKIFLAADARARAAAVLVAHAGLRLETLGDYLGMDGLRVSDLPEMKIRKNGVQFKKIPTEVVVRKPLSKAKHQYFTFLSEEGCGYLKDYLDERIRSGEKIHFDSSVVTPKHAKKSFIRTVNISDMLRVPIRRAGFKWRPYVLRAFFDNQLMIANSKRLMLKDYRQFFMGAKGNIEAQYIKSRCKLPSRVVEEIRSAYAQSQAFLQTAQTWKDNENRLKTTLREQLLILVGYRKDELEKLDIGKIGDDDFQRMAKERLLVNAGDDGSKQKVVSVTEVEKHIAQGWKYVATLPNSSIVLRLPH